MMTVEQLAVFLQRDARELKKLANQGNLPAHKISGEYRFHPVEIRHWLETQIHGYTDEELSNLEQGPAARSHDTEPLLTTMLSPATIAVPLLATTKASVLNQLVKVAEQSWQVYDPAAILDAIRQREDLVSTAVEGGVAIPHPRRPMPDALGESLVAFGRTFTSIPFGAVHGGLTDLFFLVCCRDDRTHLRALARLARLFLRPGFLDALREEDAPATAFRVIEASEAELLAADD